eukprot:2214961-Pyramimonas_sp.AAC.1
MSVSFGGSNWCSQLACRVHCVQMSSATAPLSPTAARGGILVVGGLSVQSCSALMPFSPTAARG